MWREQSKGHCSFSDPSPTYMPQSSKEACPALVNIESCAPYNVTGLPRQRNMAQMKEQIKTSEKELSDEEIANLSDAEFKTLVTRMLTEMIEYGCKIKEEMKAVQNEIKENIQGTNCYGKETRIQINDSEQRKK